MCDYIVLRTKKVGLDGIKVRCTRSEKKVSDIIWSLSEILIKVKLVIDY